ncbi:MAG: hypothetical protein K0U72_16565 [Gammaproteobacteria bacterium]|nr:hypothetical protein [Gammaproteobacteria bacterium]
MIRLIGILCGSALAISLLIVVLGIPEILPDVPARMDSMPTDYGQHREVLPEQDQTIAELQAVASAAAEDAEQTTINDIDSQERAADLPLSDLPAIDETGTFADTKLDAGTTVSPTSPSEDNWYAFWSPFRSELAANGFVSQLQRTTGLDYRVVKVKTGVYEVAFAYADNDDIESKLATIASATGLELPGG